jgi:hypothetical protein
MGLVGLAEKFKRDYNMSLITLVSLRPISDHVTGHPANVSIYEMYYYERPAAIGHACTRTLAHVCSRCARVLGKSLHSNSCGCHSLTCSQSNWGRWEGGVRVGDVTAASCGTHIDWRASVIAVSVVMDVPSNRLKLISDAVNVRSFVSESELSCACAT